jgi:hypothetical protein
MPTARDGGRIKTGALVQVCWCFCYAAEEKPTCSPPPPLWFGSLRMRAVWVGGRVPWFDDQPPAILPLDPRTSTPLSIYQDLCMP